MKERWERTFGSRGSGLCHRERWTNEFHTVGAINFRIISIITAVKALGVVAKESLHFIGGSEGDQKFAGSLTGESPGVRDFARGENGITGFQMETV